MKITILACIAILKQMWLQIKHTVLFPDEFTDNTLRQRAKGLINAFDFLRPCEIYPFYKGCRLDCCKATKFECWKEFVSNPNIDWE